MPLAIHIGVRKDEVRTFNGQMNRLLNDDFASFIQPFDWNTGPGEDEALHLVIETMTPMVVLNFIVANFQNFLVENRLDNLDGVKIFVTDATDFTSEYIELRFPE